MKLHESGKYSITVHSEWTMSVSMNWVAYESAVDCHTNTNQSTNNQVNQVKAMKIIFKKNKLKPPHTSSSPFPASDHSCTQFIGADKQQVCE